MRTKVSKNFGISQPEREITFGNAIESEHSRNIDAVMNVFIINGLRVDFPCMLLPLPII